MSKQASYQEILKQEMVDLFAQLDLPELYQKTIRSRWLDQVLWLEKKADQNRRLHYRLRLTTIVGGVILPALIGINFKLRDNPTFEHWLLYLTFGLSQVIAISAAVEEFCQFGDRWRQYRQTGEALKTEGWYYLQSSGPYEKYDSHLEAYPLFASRVESLIKDDVRTYVTELMMQAVQTEKPDVDAIGANPNGMPDNLQQLQIPSSIGVSGPSQPLHQPKAVKSV